MQEVATTNNGLIILVFNWKSFGKSYIGFDSLFGIMKKKGFDPLKIDNDPKLTRKQKGFVKDIAEGKTGTEAALNNYETEDENTAAVIASENLRKPNIVLALKDAFPNTLLEKKHLQLLNASTLNHESYPLGPRDEIDKLKWIEARKSLCKEKGVPYTEIDYLTDEDIIQMLKDINCTVKRIVHRDTARDVYYWSADNLAQDRALDKAYKIRGEYAPEKRELSGVNGEPLFSNEHKSKAKRAISGFLNKRNSG